METWLQSIIILSVILVALLLYGQFGDPSGASLLQTPAAPFAPMPLPSAGPATRAAMLDDSYVLQENKYLALQTT